MQFMIQFKNCEVAITYCYVEIECKMAITDFNETHYIVYN